MYKVQVGWKKGSYEPKYEFDNEHQAALWYSAVNVHSGGKKRLLDPDGNVIDRVIT